MNRRRLEALARKLEEWDELTRKATTPPWKPNPSEHFGEDWHIASLGNSGEDGLDWIVQTDGVRASELLGDAKTDALFIAEARTALPILLRITRAFVAEKLRALEGDGDGAGQEAEGDRRSE